MTNSRFLLALVGACLVAQKLPAQACLAAPRSGHGWVGARFARTSLERNLVGADAGVRVADAVAVRAQVDQVTFDDLTPTRNRGAFGVVVGSRSWKLPVCFTGSAMLTKLGDLSVVTLPIGISAGWDIPLAAGGKSKNGGGASLTTYVEPRLAYRRGSIKGFHDVSAPFSMLGGSGISGGRLYGGVDFEWSPSESHTWSVGLRAAIGF
jgi:hypothetical protein